VHSVDVVMVRLRDPLHRSAARLATQSLLAGVLGGVVGFLAVCVFDRTDPVVIVFVGLAYGGGASLGELFVVLLGAALVGVAGLVPTVRALETGIDVALANKESLVTGGQIIDALSAESGAKVIPVDSEHFSLARCLKGHEGETAELILTASGGPFLGRDIASLGDVTVPEVLDHPTWSMGRKVTVDSAHLLNKGLEVIEAHWLFGFDYGSIGVVIHPQSRVHGLARLKDGSLMAHLGPADMRLPIISALYHPAMVSFPWEHLSLVELSRLDFQEFEQERYPAFVLVMEAARTGGTAPAVLNAADEIAVEAFLAGRIGFLDIIEWIERALAAHTAGPAGTVEEVLEADRWAREYLREIYGGPSA